MNVAIENANFQAFHKQMPNGESMYVVVDTDNDVPICWCTDEGAAQCIVIALQTMVLLSQEKGTGRHH